MAPEQIITLAIERFEKPLISYAKQITGDLDSARDAVQETFLRLSRQDLEKLEPRLAPWLYFVCRNCAMDYRRKNGRYQELLEEEDLPLEMCPRQTLVDEEDKQQLAALVARLTARQRELLKLKFEADLTYKEMAEVMKMSISNIGVQLHETIRTLRKLWNTDQPLTDQPAP
jgi:RNA polymerase sigma-70 factor (ECF subfamily)